MLFNSYVEILNIIYKGVDGKKEEGVKRQMIWMEGITGTNKQRNIIKYEKCL